MRRLTLFLSFLLLAFSATPALSEAQWTEVKSPHFTVLTDAGEKSGREVALRFEQVHDSFGAILQKLRVNSPVPLTIIAFRNSKEISNYAPLYKGKPIVVAGLFLSGGDRNFILVDLSSEAGWHVVYHEYAHLLLHANFPPVPRWFDEGFAEYFASLRVDKRDLYFGEMSDSQRYLLQRFPWMKAAKLFSVGPDSPEYNENGDHRSVFYAESWLVVHYLMDEKKLGEASKFLDLTEDSHQPVPAAFQATFGMPVERFDKELDRYYHGILHYYRQPAPAGMAEGAYSSRPLTQLDAQALLADCDSRSRDHRDRAVATYEAVLQKDPNNGFANRGLGYFKLMTGHEAEARPLLEKAVASNPKDPLANYYFAMMLSRTTTSVADDSGAGRRVSRANREASAMKAHAEAAIAADPQYADAYEMLGQAQMIEGDRVSALASLHKAMQLNPQNDSYLMNIGNVFRMTGDSASAKKVFSALANRANSPLAGEARIALENMDRDNNMSARAPVVVVPGAQEGLQEPVIATSSVTASVSPIHFVKGKLLNVDCSAQPGAKLRVQVEGKDWTFSAADRKHLVLLGEDDFSCQWHDRNIAVNYREGGEQKGDIVSLEFQ